VNLSEADFGNLLQALSRVNKSRRTYEKIALNSAISSVFAV
jgi:hypothetical protein